MCDRKSSLLSPSVGQLAVTGAEEEEEEKDVQNDDTISELHRCVLTFDVIWSSALTSYPANILEVCPSSIATAS